MKTLAEYDLAAFRRTIRQRKHELPLFCPDNISPSSESGEPDEMSGVIGEIYADDWTQSIESPAAYKAVMSLSAKDRKILDLYISGWPEADIAAAFKGSDIYYRLKKTLRTIQAAYAADNSAPGRRGKDIGGDNETEKRGT